MKEKSPLDENQLKLYFILIDQLQKYTSILWQFPIALLVANFFALDKFLSEPVVLLALSFIDSVLVYALHRLVIQQRSIIAATKKAEAIIQTTKYEQFIPNFSVSKVRAPTLIVWTLASLTLALSVLAIASLYTSCSFP